MEADLTLIQQQQGDLQRDLHEAVARGQDLEYQLSEERKQKRTIIL